MEAEVPQEPQDEQPAVPEAPQPIDPRAALEIAAQQYGVTPDYLESAMRLQSENQRVYEENRRRARELEIRQAQIDALEKDRNRYAPPEPTSYDVDPVVRPLFEKVNSLERILLQERQERVEQDRRQHEAQRTAHELNSHIETLMRGVPTQNQIPPEKFYAGMAELWPNAEFRELGITPAQAVERTARYLGIQSNGFVPQQNTMRNGYVAPYGNPATDRRAAVVIPGVSAPSTQTPSGMTDTRPYQLPGESDEQYRNRIVQILKDNNVRGLQDGQRVSSG